MKKLFAIFCAICLMPSFSAQAWIGGPFSNNSYFGLGGDDGIYEAIATGANTLGYYRIVIANNSGSIGTPTTTTQAAGTPPSINGVLASGNGIIGGQGNQSTSLWYVEGITYAGRAFGTVSMWAGAITGMSTADEVTVNDYLAGTVSSQFTAAFQNTGALIPSRAFFGAGVLTVNFAPAGTQGPFVTPAGGQIPLTIYGSKVSYQFINGL